MEERFSSGANVSGTAHRFHDFVMVVVSPVKSREILKYSYLHNSSRIYQQCHSTQARGCVSDSGKTLRDEAEVCIWRGKCVAPGCSEHLRATCIFQGLSELLILSAKPWSPLPCDIKTARIVLCSE